MAFFPLLADWPLAVDTWETEIRISNNSAGRCMVAGGKATETTMTPQDRTQIEAACIRLQQRYGTLADRQDPKFRELFIEDAVIALPEYPPFTGLDKIMAGQAQWRESGVVMRHVCTNFTIEVVDAERATGICYLMVFHYEPPDAPSPELPPSLPVSIGEFHDEFVLQGGEWRFKSRTLKRIFRGMTAP
jgi:hypothetical protein